MTQKHPRKYSIQHILQLPPSPQSKDEPPLGETHPVAATSAPLEEMPINLSRKPSTSESRWPGERTLEPCDMDYREQDVAMDLSMKSDVKCSPPSYSVPRNSKVG
ncbi:hypothetical protein RUM43_006352 [Polyplax serrata]|uniref:Uncharacterized protein n=1 Tax=Polyplax serrata TaxID=468196 RepID=A0AAN8S238_POLSC